METSIQVYAAARTYQLPSLQELAKSEIERLGRDLPEVSILSAIKDAYPDLRADDTWMAAYLMARMEALLKNPSDLLATGFADIFGDIAPMAKMLLQTLLRLCCKKMEPDAVESELEPIDETMPEPNEETVFEPEPEPEEGPEPFEKPTETVSTEGPAEMPIGDSQTPYIKTLGKATTITEPESEFAANPVPETSDDGSFVLEENKKRVKKAKAKAKKGMKGSSEAGVCELQAEHVIQGDGWKRCTSCRDFVCQLSRASADVEEYEVL